MNFIGMLTKKIARGSGYAEILIEAKLVTSVTLVFSGKKYSKALFNLNDYYLNCCTYFFDEENETEIHPQALLNLINACSSSSCCEQLDEDLPDESVTHITNKYEEFQTKVRDGHLGNTAQFWIFFMDNSKLIFLLTHAVKKNNRKLFHMCNG